MSTNNMIKSKSPN